MALSDPYVPAIGGMTNRDYANYMQSQKGIANLLVDKDAVADFLDQNGMDSEEFIDEYIDQLYGPGRMNHLREGLKDGLEEMLYQVALELGTHYGAAGAGWFGARILGWAAKKFSSMWSAWRGSRVVTRALAEGVEASAEQSARGLKGTPGPTPDLHTAPLATGALPMRPGMLGLKDVIKNATGLSLNEAGKFFGWGRPGDLKLACSFTRDQLESRGFTRKVLEEILAIYESIAKLPSDNGLFNQQAPRRAQQMRQLIDMYF
jgi:hypothetical protein